MERKATCLSLNLFEFLPSFAHLFIFRCASHTETALQCQWLGYKDYLETTDEIWMQNATEIKYKKAREQSTFSLTNYLEQLAKQSMIFLDMSAEVKYSPARFTRCLDSSDASVSASRRASKPCRRGSRIGNQVCAFYSVRVFEARVMPCSDKPTHLLFPPS